MAKALSLCVYCGSRLGKNPAYEKDARALGSAIAMHGWRLVYGAGDVGLMGAVADAAIAGGAETLGVIPTHLLSREAPENRSTQRIVTETMHERKKVMFMNADAVAVLPGGAGSLDEFFEVLTWRQLGLHEKPIYILNTDGYWTTLIQTIDHVIAEGFADASLSAYMTAVDNVDELVTALSAQPA
ncbi:MAG: TIGR00730 family Rossman fold protein [Pseudomonadota bacterium]